VARAKETGKSAKATVYPVAAMNRFLARRPQDAWAATISKPNG